MAAAKPVTYLVFDLLWLDDESLVDRPYDERRVRLETLGLDGPHWQTPAAHPGQGRELFAATAEQQLEGVIAKRRDSHYVPGGRSDAWLKVKHQLRQEFVVGGWWPGKGGRRGTLGSLQIGVHDGDGHLRYAGGVGTGFDRDTLDRLHAQLVEHERDRSPFEGRQPQRGTRFVDPTMVVEVRFAGWTDEGSVRQAAFLGVRDDRDPADVVREDAPAVAVNEATADEETAGDADGNGKSTRSDGGGFSRNPKLSLISMKPKYASVAIPVGNGVKQIDVVLNYLHGLSIGPVARN